MQTIVTGPSAETYSTARELRSLLGSYDWREALESMIDNEDDFTVSNYRFIHADDIDEIMREELSTDPYILGCFTPWFIADILLISIDAVEKIQKAEAFEGLGEMMLAHIDEVQEKYAAADGYGHHFSHYDGSEQKIGSYYVFRVN